MAIRDLPDYQKKIVVVTVPGVYPAEMQVDHRKILGVALKSPYVAASVPSSIENPALAYDSVNDRFKVDIEDATGVTFQEDVTDRWARQLGQVDIARVLGAALSHANPFICRLSNGTVFIDPRDRNWVITEALARSWNLGASDIPDLSDRAARLLGRVYGSQGQQLLQRALTYESVVQLSHQGSEYDALKPADLNLDATKDLQVDVKTLPPLPAGTNNIGDIDVLTLPNVTLASQVNPFTSNLPIANPSNLDVALSTRALEAGGNLAAIKAKTDNIDTALSARTHTKHDAKTYKTAVFDATASGNLVAAVAAKVIKLHALTIQAQGTVVVNLNNGSGGSSLMEWSFQAREGAVIPMANAPAYWAITSVNTALYVTLSAAVTVTITAIYSDDDTS